MLIRTSIENCKRVVLMLPDLPAIQTLRAQGYEQQDAERRSRLDYNTLENRIERIVAELPEGADRVKVLRWIKLQENAPYAEMNAAIRRLYHADTLFRNDVRATTKAVLQTALQRGELRSGNKRIAPSSNSIETVLESMILEERIDIGITFFLDELALIADAARITGCAQSAYVYHQEMSVVQNLFKGKYAWTPAPENGYVIYRSDEDVLDSSSP